MLLRSDLIRTARRMLTLGLATGSFGNVSCLQENGILITPSGLAYDKMQPEDLVLLDHTGVAVEGDRLPSSEYRLHVEIYSRIPSALAIVHTHSACAVKCAESMTEVSLLGDGALPLRVPVAPFMPAGSQALAEQAAHLLADQMARAVILQGHGVVGIGADLADALAVCRAVECVAVIACASQLK